MKTLVYEKINENTLSINFKDETLIISNMDDETLQKYTEKLKELEGTLLYDNQVLNLEELLDRYFHDIKLR
jgi:hypothetical protein